MQLSSLNSKQFVYQKLKLKFGLVPTGFFMKVNVMN